MSSIQTDSAKDDQYSYSYHTSHRRKTKSDWAGVVAGDSFKRNLDFSTRRFAQRIFYGMVHAVQIAAMKLAGVTDFSTKQPRIKAQLSPVYTTYPTNLAAYAAYGHTAFLEFEHWNSTDALMVVMKDYLENPAYYDGVRVDPQIYTDVVKMVAKTVQTRLFLEDLSRHPPLQSVEMYRLFSASQQTMKFRFVGEIINAVVLYGDVFPDWRTLDLHPVTSRMFADIYTASRPHLASLKRVDPVKHLEVGKKWVSDVSKGLAKYLPDPGSKEDNRSKRSPFGPTGRIDPDRFKFNTDLPEMDSEKIPPLDGKQPPSLFGPENLAEQMAKSLFGQGDKDKTVSPGEQYARKIFDDFSRTLQMAAGQHKNWEDMRSDIVENAIRQTVFCPGPIEGNPVDGHEISVPMGDNKVENGEIFDRPIPLSEDMHSVDKLLARAKPITDKMRRVLYPNIEELPQIDRFRASGSLDPARLPLYAFSKAIFRRNRILEQADPRGCPVLAIACDGSGSQNAQQMSLAKVMSAAWLVSTAKTDIQVLAGLYHSGSIRHGVSGPLVQWMYHPQKTPAISSRDAVRALVTLPDHGTGVQSDALSIAFITDEARRLARGRMIYLVLITDCAWNQSFRSSKNGKQEVYSLMENLTDQLKSKLHTTLVALGVNGATGFENLLDKVININRTELTDPVAVAEKIGLYVASIMRERQKWLAKNQK